MKSENVERKCAWCGALFALKVHNARFCASACKERARYARHRESRKRAARMYRAKNKADVNNRQRKRYRDFKSGNPEAWRIFCNKMKARTLADRADNPEKHAKWSREWRRRRAASEALSAILLPVKKHPEV